MSVLYVLAKWLIIFVELSLFSTKCVQGFENASTGRPNLTSIDLINSTLHRDHAKTKNVHLINQKITDQEETKFLNEFFDNYDKRIRPNNENQPVLVTVGLLVHTVYSINDESMDYRLNIFLRTRWNDPRLAYSNQSDSFITVHPSMLDKIWIPDIFFTNEKQANFHKITTDNKLMRIYGNGDIYSSVRISLTLACNMNLRIFPMDIQTCKIEMESFGFDTRDIVFEWENKSPIEFPHDIKLPQFLLKGHTLKSCSKTYSTGTFTCIGVDFILERQMGYYYIQMYIPSTLIVILSWVSFWINMDAAPARTALGITTVLTLTTQSSGARASLPKVSYIKAIDVWFSTCLTFVFAALVEFAIVNFLSRAEKELLKAAKSLKERRKLQNSITQSAENEDLKISMLDQNKSNFDEETSLKEKYISKARKIDRISRLVFSSIFVVFNVFYWGIYLTRRFELQKAASEAILYDN